MHQARTYIIMSCLKKPNVLDKQSLQPIHNIKREKKNAFYTQRPAISKPVTMTGTKQQ